MPEGNPYTNLLKMMKLQGYNKDSDISFGKVTSISPLKFKVNDFEIEPGDYIITESLIEHKREAEISVKTVTATTSQNSNHTHTLTPFEITKAEITVKSPLKVGDLVLILIDGDNFFVIDRVVIK
jgi:hypothetical protein